MGFSRIKQEMPLLGSQEGVWADTYRWVDAEGRLIDEHRCTMLVTFPEEPPYAYRQTNMYTWPDGRAKTKDFCISYVEGSGRFAIWDRDVAGWVCEPREDDQHLTTLMKWVRLGGGPEDDGVYYEMINNSPCGRYRARVWQQLQQGQVVRRCFINGEKVAGDWRPFVDGNPDWDYCTPEARRAVTPA